MSDKLEFRVVGTQKYTKAVAIDLPEFGASHVYQIFAAAGDVPDAVIGQVTFQKGPIKEHGVNGCHNEDLIAIVIDRLTGFQTTDFKCRENALALTKLEEALHWLNHRTKARENRGVEGTHKI